jgi:uncharacterized membrane protein
MVAFSPASNRMNPAMCDFTHPWFLTLALAIGFWLLWAQRRSLARFTSAQRRWCLGIRTLLLVFLVLALAGARLILPSRELAVLFVVDESASISEKARKAALAWVEEAAKTKPSDDVAGIIAFARSARVAQPPAERLVAAANWNAPSSKGEQTDIGGAVEFATAMFPVERARRLVLLTDGNDTQNGALRAAQQLARDGVDLVTVPLRNGDAPEVLVENVEAPRRLKTGEPFDLVAHLRANIDTRANVRLYQNQFLIEERELTLHPGVNEFRAANIQPEGNFVTYEVEAIPVADTLAENNRAQTTVSLRGQPRVLIVDAQPEKNRALPDVLRKEKIEVETRSALGAPKTLEDLQQFDFFILHDVSALSLGRDQMELYRRWVQDFGGGFVMIGGEQSYGVGGYFRTPIEQMLPVRMEHQDRQDVPSVALLIVLDRSGSMTAQVQGVPKMSLANQGAALALNVLQAKDYFGVLAVDTRAHTIAPLQQHPSKAAVEQRILSINAGGGGIYIYTSLAEAFQMLRDVPARVKHVIVFSDAADAEEKVGGEMGDGVRGGGSSLELASAMLAAKITTSVVALGMETDKDTGFLRQLAERGNGRFYLTSDATTLPQIFSTETMKVAQTSLVEEPFLAQPMSKSPIIAGIDWAQSPLLLGYNATKPKPTADLLLASERGEPLLAVWRFGLGQAAAFTSDAKNRWAAEWLSWPGFGKFWTQLVRGMMRKSDQATFAIDAVETGDRLKIEVDAVTPEGAFQNGLPLSVHALGDDQQSRTVDAIQTAPGRYSASLDLPERGSTIVSVTSPKLPEGGAVFGHTRSYPREFLSTGTNETLLRQMSEAARGSYDPRPAEIFAKRPPRRAHPRPLTPFFLIAALALMPLDIWLRRRTWTS